MAGVDEAMGDAVSTGVGIRWYRSGAGGPVVVLLPTWNLLDSRTWNLLVPKLSQRCTVVTYDPRGAGQSGRPPAGYSLDDHVGDALAVLDASGVGSATVVGLSTTTNVAVALAASQPNRVDRIVLLSVGLRDGSKALGFWEPWSGEGGWARHNAASWRSDFEAYLRFFFGEAFHEPDSEHLIEEAVLWGLEADPEILITQAREQEGEDVTPLLNSIRCPTDIVHGGGNRVVPLEKARRAAAAIPRAQLHVIPDACHGLHRRHPEVLARLLLQLVEP